MPTEEEIFAQCDLNSDGKIDGKDFVVMSRNNDQTRVQFCKKYFGLTRKGAAEGGAISPAIILVFFAVVVVLALFWTGFWRKFTA